MSRQEKVLEKKKLGRPAIGKGIQINAMHRPEDVVALDAWIAQQPDPKPSRPEAVRLALKDWLTGMGLLKGLTVREKIAKLEEKIAALPEHAGPSPEAAMATMQKAYAENELAKLKNGHKPRVRRKHDTEGSPQ